MRAIVIHQHGGIEELKMEEVPTPSPGKNEILVKVKAVGLNYLDIFVRKGSPGLRIEFPHIGGGDIAGIIAETGHEVKHLQPGQRVLLDPIITLPNGHHGALGEDTTGGLADYISVSASNAIPLPDEVSFEDAASLPIAYGTAWRMLITRGHLKAGEDILILGASGGVGTGALQIAKMIGARTWVASSSEEKLNRLKELGADELINYSKNPDFHKEIRSRRNGKGVDVVVNFTGGDTWVRSLKALNHHGRLLTCGGTAGYFPPTDIRYIFRRELDILGSDGWQREDLIQLLEAVKDGSIKPIIDQIFPLEEVGKAHQKLEDRKVFGKLIVTP